MTLEELDMAALEMLLIRYHSECDKCPEKGLTESKKTSFLGLMSRETSKSTCEECPTGKEINNVRSELVKKRRETWGK